jgi:tetratricopeptide (TPR) repeat protein
VPLQDPQLLYSDNNQFEDSINAFKKCIILNSKAVESYNNLGIVYLKQENYPKALEIISIGTEADPNFFGIYNNLGLAYLGLKNFERTEDLEGPEGLEGLERPEGPEGLERPEGPEGLERPEGPDVLERPEGP